MIPRHAHCSMVRETVIDTIPIPLYISIKQSVDVALRATELKFKIYYYFRCSNTRVFRMDIVFFGYVDIILYSS